MLVIPTEIRKRVPDMLPNNLNKKQLVEWLVEKLPLIDFEPTEDGGIDYLIEQLYLKSKHNVAGINPLKRHQCEDLIWKIAEGFSDFEYIYFSIRYGIVNGKVLSQKECAKLFGMLSPKKALDVESSIGRKFKNNNNRLIDYLICNEIPKPKNTPADKNFDHIGKAAIIRDKGSSYYLKRAEIIGYEGEGIFKLSVNNQVITLNRNQIQIRRMRVRKPGEQFDGKIKVKVKNLIARKGFRI